MEDPTVWVPDHEQYGGVPRGSVPPVGNLPDGWGPIGPMNHESWRITVLTLTTRLPATFDWLVGDAEWAMGIARAPMATNGGVFSAAAGA